MVLRKLQYRSINGVTPTNQPFIMTEGNLKYFIFMAMYSPVRLFPILAGVLDILEVEGEELGSLVVPLEYEPFCSASATTAASLGNEATYAIMCGDKRYQLNETIPNLKEMFHKMSDYSWFADVWLSVMIGCDGWAINSTDPPMEWDDHPAHFQKPINTSFPLLFLSNTYDPVTPLSAAVKMAQRFSNAGLLEQKAQGHCTISTVSGCTIRRVREYLREGKVPPPPNVYEVQREGNTNIVNGYWDTCEADEAPWRPYNKGEWMQEAIMSVSNGSDESAVTARQMETMWEQAEILEAWKELQEISAEKELLWDKKRWL